jgi:hypothetical protein
MPMVETLAPGRLLNVTGVVTADPGGWRIEPRSAADIVVVGDPDVLGTPRPAESSSETSSPTPLAIGSGPTSTALGGRSAMLILLVIALGGSAAGLGVTGLVVRRRAGARAPGVADDAASDEATPDGESAPSGDATYDPSPDPVDIPTVVRPPMAVGRQARVTLERP